jgi:flagellar biosynthesis/type III secretory pathway chaperone
MSALTDDRAVRVIDAPLGDDLIAHLDSQVASAQRLLQIVLEQGVAIRDRDVETVVRYAGAMQVEMQRRVSIEQTRARLLERAGVRLGVTAASVTLDLLAQLLDGPTAHLARERSAQLRGLLEEIKREHTVNRALMQQELAFLDHLLRLIGGDGSGAYHADRTPGATSAPGSSRRRVFDLEV